MNVENEPAGRWTFGERQLAHLTALETIAEGLSGALPELLAQSAEHVKQVLGATAVHIRLISEDRQSVDVQTAVGAPAAFLAQESCVAMGECACGLVAQQGVPVVIGDVELDARVTRCACHKFGYRAVLGAPLRSRRGVVGVLIAHSATAEYWADPADVRLLVAVGYQLGLAVENARLNDEMEKYGQQLLQRIEHGVIVRERERISREIHDGLAQALALLNLRVNVAHSLLAAGQMEQTRQELVTMAQVIDTANCDVREAITALRLTAPKGADFVPMLHEFVLEFGARNDMQVEFTVEGANGAALAPLAEVHLIRVIQEALSNVRKHAHAQRVGVHVEQQRRSWQVVIQDDGQGFDMDAMLTRQNRHSLGLTTMHERIMAIGGGLDILTQVGGGTRVAIRVPLEG